MHVNNTPPPGSFFAVTLTKDSVKSLADGHQKSTDNSNDLAKYSIRVLLVEDDRVNQVVTSSFLKKWGIAFDIANNGQEAVNMIQLKPYHLVLMDLQMPVMDGYEATQCIRSLSKQYYKDVPIIALTASEIVGTREKVMEVGMNDFIGKPFAPDEFQASIKRLIPW